MLIKMLVFGQDIVHFPFSGSSRWEHSVERSEGRRSENRGLEGGQRCWDRLVQTPGDLESQHLQGAGTTPGGGMAIG